MMSAEQEKSPVCGIIMPISAIDNCSADHWAEIKSIIFEAVASISSPTFSVKMVSDADDVGVIQKRIVQNIYTSDIIVCDVSGKNPNVMFELGMRLAFDKPTVIIKDDKTDYSFDTGVIEHLPYPRDLRFAKIVTFKSILADKVLATYKAAKDDQSHSTFLKNFGKFQVASLNQDAVPADKLVVEMLGDIQTEMNRLRNVVMRESPRRRYQTLGSPAYSKIQEAMLSIMAENPGELPSDFLTDRALRSELERRVNASIIFDNRSEFEEALIMAVSTMPKSHSE